MLSVLELRAAEIPPAQLRVWGQPRLPEDSTGRGMAAMAVLPHVLSGFCLCCWPQHGEAGAALIFTPSLALNKMQVVYLDCFCSDLQCTVSETFCC